MSDSTNQGSVRMLALVTEALHGYGGIAQYNCDYLMAAARLPEIAGIDVHPRIAEPNVRLQQGKLRQRRAVYNRFLYSLRALFCALFNRPQVVFCGHLYHVELARWVARISGAKLISQLHGSEIWGDLPSDLVDGLAASDVVFCVSDHTKSTLKAQSNLSDEKIVVLPNRIRDLFGLQDKRAARQSLELGELPIVLSVGRLDNRQGYKGHDRIISVMNTLKDKDLCFDYVIVGEGEDRPRLEALVEAEALTDRVHFLGRVNEDHLPSIYAAADLFALPSTGEGFGIVFIEASACGTPVIGLDVGGAPEAMCDEKWCWAVAPDEFELRFEEALRQSLQITEAERAELSRVTHRQFGAGAFNQRVQAAMKLVS